MPSSVNSSSLQTRPDQTIKGLLPWVHVERLPAPAQQSEIERC